MIGCEESISTTQLDFAQPIRFDLAYIGEDGNKHRPFIVHRAPLGAHERFTLKRAVKADENGAAAQKHEGF